MTDLSTTAPIKIRRFGLPRLGFPKRGIGAALTGTFGLMKDAFRMAYVDPYAGLCRRPQIATDEYLEGRDPSW